MTGEAPLVLHEFFESWVDRTPDGLALVCRDLRLSYREVEERANRLARLLRQRGVGPETLVGLYMDRGEQHVVAILAILKAGGAYVPLDVKFPLERIQHIAGNCAMALIVTEDLLQPSLEGLGAVPLLNLDAEAAALAALSPLRLTRQETGVSPCHLCYIMYTSGTTGRPKGIMAEHRNVVAFVQVFNDELRLTRQDCIYHGFSLGFDGSVEELWAAYSNGLPLVVGTSDIVQFGNEVAALLTREGVTYLSTVPTFLSLISVDMPTVRIIVTSGEACPQALLDKWAPGRRFLNVYGPTECTVNTTSAELQAGCPVTIGKPLQGYHLYVLDEQGQPVASGEKGELFIAGVTVARGYMNEPELTARQFVENPFDTKEISPKLYRTGDLVQWDVSGDLLFFGRIDHQVKIRGFRIELAEIEAVLRNSPQIAQAVVSVYEHDGLRELAAYVVLAVPTQPLDREATAVLLRERLAPYMVPRYLQVIAALPQLTSGKVDRKALPPPQEFLLGSDRTIVEPVTPFEVSVLDIWERLFKLSPISVEDDFFQQLGGDSLLAAQMVTHVRQELGVEVSIREVYQHPTLQQFAAALEQVGHVHAASQLHHAPTSAHLPARDAILGVPRWERILAKGLQALSIFGFYILIAVPVLFFALLFKNANAGKITTVQAGIWCGLGGLLIYPASLAVSLGIKWAVVGRYRPGTVPLWSLEYWRFWTAHHAFRLSGAGLLAGTPLFNVYLRLAGAKIGPGVRINTGHLAIFDLLSIGAGSALNAESQVLGYRVENGRLQIGRIDIGQGCYVGISAMLDLDTCMEDGAALDDLSLLYRGETIPAGQARRGSPAVAAMVDLPQVDSGQSTWGRRAWVALGHGLAIYGLELFLMVTLLPTGYITYHAFRVNTFQAWLLLVVAAVPAFEITFCTLMVGLKWLVLPRVQPGVYSIYSGLYLRKWFVNELIATSRLVVLPIYTTLYFVPWIRALGAKVGKWAEFSVLSQFAPEMMEVGDGSFFADGSILAHMRLFGGSFQVGVTRVGARSFVGNSAVLPVGAEVGSHCLLGVLSTTPGAKGRVEDGTEWLGSPAFRLPHRTKVEGFGEAELFKPTPKLIALRLVIDGLRIAAPSCLEIFGLIATVSALAWMAEQSYSIGKTLLVLPFVLFGVGTATSLGVVLMKKVLIYVYHPVIKPLWSPYIWINEAINGAYEAVAAPYLAMLTGTPFLQWYLRLLGCKIGKETFIDTTLFGEFDLVEIGDFVALNHDVIVQNHLFEDRIFKSSRLTIGAGCSVGTMGVVLYDTMIGEGATVGPLSLVMKGETLPPHTHWVGVPLSNLESSPVALFH